MADLIELRGFVPGIVRGPARGAGAGHSRSTSTCTPTWRRRAAPIAVSLTTVDYGSLADAVERVHHHRALRAARAPLPAQRLRRGRPRRRARRRRDTVVVPAAPPPCPQQLATSRCPHHVAPTTGSRPPSHARRRPRLQPRRSPGLPARGRPVARRRGLGRSPARPIPLARRSGPVPQHGRRARHRPHPP